MTSPTIKSESRICLAHAERLAKIGHNEDDDQFRGSAIQSAHNALFLEVLDWAYDRASPRPRTKRTAKNVHGAMLHHLKDHGEVEIASALRAMDRDRKKAQYAHKNLPKGKERQIIVNANIEMARRYIARLENLPDTQES